MEDTLIELLSSLGYEVYRQGSFAEGDQYPESFFTFWQTDSPDHAHYDNNDFGTEWRFSEAALERWLSESEPKRKAAY